MTEVPKETETADFSCHLVNTGLEPAYYDVDTLMLHACMSLLCRYIEHEMGGESSIEEFNRDLRKIVDPNEPDGMSSAQADCQEEALTIYRWWRHDRPTEEKRRDELCTRLYGQESRMSFAPTDDARLNQIKFKPFDGEEIGLNVEFRALEAKIDSDEQAMLHRLIDIRSSLWT